MFNSFVAFISSLLTDAVIQEVALQAWDECFLEFLAKKPCYFKVTIPLLLVFCDFLNVEQDAGPRERLEMV